MKKVLSILVITMIVGTFSTQSFAGVTDSKSKEITKQETPKSTKDSKATKCCAKTDDKQVSAKVCTEKDKKNCKTAKKDCKVDKKDCPAKTSEAKGTCPGTAKTAQK